MLNLCQIKSHVPLDTYWLATQEPVSYVYSRFSMFPETKWRGTNRSEGEQNPMFPWKGVVIKGFVIQGFMLLNQLVFQVFLPGVGIKTNRSFSSSVQFVSFSK